MTTAYAAEFAQLRADAARERDDLRTALESRAQVLEESRSCTPGPNARSATSTPRAPSWPAYASGRADDRARAGRAAPGLVRNPAGISLPGLLALA